MNDNSDSLQPYSFEEVNDMDFVFTTDAGHVYHAYFLDYSMYHNKFGDVYSFNIEPEDASPHPIDMRIAHTIITILKQFFANRQRAIVYICDSTDSKEQKRDALFERWYTRFAPESLLKYNASLQTPDYALYVSLLLMQDNPNREPIVEAFFELVRNNFYPL